MSNAPKALSVLRTMCAPEDIEVIAKKGLAMTHILEGLAERGRLSIGMGYIQHDDRHGQEKKTMRLSLEKDTTMSEEVRTSFIRTFVHGARQRLDIVVDCYVSDDEIERRVMNFAHGAGASCPAWSARAFCTSGRGQDIIPTSLTEGVLPTHNVIYRGMT